MTMFSVIKKLGKVLAMFALLGYFGSSTAQTTNIVEFDGVSVSPTDLEFALKSLPISVATEIVTDPEQTKKIALDLLARKLMAKSARQVAEGSEAALTELNFRIMDAENDFLIDQFKKSLVAPDLESIALEQYEARKNEIAFVPEQRQVSHILIRCETGCTDKERAKIDVVKGRLAAGESFEALAKSYSEDPGSARRAGKLSTPVEKKNERIDYSFRNAVFDLEEVGQISPVVESGFGFHIIRLDAIQPSGFIAFERLKDQIIELIKSQWVAEKVAEYRASFLKGKSPQVDLSSLPILNDSDLLNN